MATARLTPPHEPETDLVRSLFGQPFLQGDHGTVGKFDESEPRDDAGRWTGGGGAALPLGGPTDYSPGYDPNERWDNKFSKDDWLYWTAASAERLAAIRDNARVPGTIGNNMLNELVDHQSRGQVTTTPIYRGAVAAWSVVYTPGQRIDLPLTSFTATQDTALAYARTASGRAEADAEGRTLNAFDDKNEHGVLFRLEPGAATIETGDRALTEHVTAGQFEVVKAAGEIHEFDAGDTHYRGGIYVVDVKQVALPDPQFPGQFIVK